MGTIAPAVPNVPDGPTWEELLCIVTRFVGTKAAAGGAYEAAKEALKTFGSVADKLYMLRSTAVRRGIDVNSPFIIDEWLLLLTERGVPVGGAENPAPTSWKPGLRSRVEQTLHGHPQDYEGGYARGGDQVRGSGLRGHQGRRGH